MKGRLIRLLVALIGVTLRYRLRDPDGVLAARPTAPLIFVFWHNRIFLMPHLYRKYWRPCGRDRLAVLISRSKDGQLLAEALAAFGLRCVRGSSSRGGAEALREMTALVREGFDIGITPDGPRGPKYNLQPGCVILAQRTGAAIIPVSYETNWKITLKSWDAFMIPLPFAHCTIQLGTPINVPPVADIETKRAEVEQALRALAAV